MQGKCPDAEKILFRTWGPKFVGPCVWLNSPKSGYVPMLLYIKGRVWEVPEGLIAFQLLQQFKFFSP